MKPVTVASPTLDLIRWWQKVYGRKYTHEMGSEISLRLNHLPEKYLAELSKLVIDQHDPSYKTLPTIPMIRRVQQQMPEAFQYRESTHPLIEDQNFREESAKAVAEVRAKGHAASPEHEMERIERRIKSGDAKLYERHWYWVVTENNGVWVHPEKGPLASEFAAEGAEGAA